ncbi:phosphoribosylaminoimidazolesuccinocarboxamide synthase [Patescibacteria group bacterium]|nr:phosphoribosylaminoimidazolesuccinocarboxamide synthase [Patescibacteria group bacterium]
MILIEDIKKQIPYVLKGTSFTNLGDVYEGKVRDNYTLGDRRLIVVTDRLSAFDCIITEIPFKGQVLNQMATFWFEKTKDIIGNHMISVPDPNVIEVMEVSPMPAEMVVRAYITGSTSTSAWLNYKNGVRNFCGNVLPEGLKKDQKLDVPILTPSTKAEHGAHDESVSKEEILKRGEITEEEFDFMAKASFELFKRGTEIAAKQGIILVDTKYEFGKTKDGKIILIDEIHTPDSSRFWYADEYQARFEAGEEQKKIDKEYVRLWLVDQGFTGEGQVPNVPDEIKVEAARRYIEAYELITGTTFNAQIGDVHARVEQNLAKYI